MTSAAAQRIRTSFILIGPQFDRISQAFYQRIFAARPDLRALFAVDMTAQRQHLAAAIALIVRNISMLDAMTVPLAELGAAHAQIGVRNDDYSSVVNALVAALSDALKPSNTWTAELEADWRALLTRVSAMMQNHSSAL